MFLMRLHKLKILLCVVQGLAKPGIVVREASLPSRMYQAAAQLVVTEVFGPEVRSCIASSSARVEAPSALNQSRPRIVYVANRNTGWREMYSFEDFFLTTIASISQLRERFAETISSRLVMRSSVDPQMLT